MQTSPQSGPTPENAKPLFSKMAVIGVGLLGGSLGMAAKANNLVEHVQGYGRNRQNLEEAIDIGAIDSIALSAKECAADADIVFICTPVRTVVKSIEEIADSLKPGAVVTDVGSTKRVIMEEAANFMHSHTHFIGGHPMAGTEKSGAKYASADLFKAATYVLTPYPNSDSQMLNKLVSFIENIGARCEIMDAYVHDKAVASISHLPHIIASSLLRVAETSNDETNQSFRLAAGSFKDLTRIADSPPEIWRDICLTNADLVCDQITELTHWLDKFKQALASSDEVEITDLFEQSRKIRQAYLRMPK